MKKSAILIAFIMCFTGTLRAGEIGKLVQHLMKKGVISPGDAQVIMTETQQEQMVDMASGKAKNLPMWVQSISMKGDLRLRHQGDWDSGKSYPRIRERMRLRIGFETRVVESLKAGFGFATGSEGISGTSVTDAEPSSTNHTFTNGFGKGMLMVDYGYLQYTPLPWLAVSGGKMTAGTHLWNTTDLLWDGDINPDGLAVNINRTVAEGLDVFFNGAWLTFYESNAAGDDADASIIQPGVSAKFAEKYSVKAAVAFQNLNVNGKNTGYYGVPAFDYICTNPSLEIKAKEAVAGYTVKLFGDMITNSDSKPGSDKNGSAYGLQFGADKISGFGQWQAKYMQRRLENNAWLNKLGDSDAYGGAVNSEGFEAIFTIGLTKTASLGIDYYAMDKITGSTKTTPKSLTQIDIVYKF